MSAESAPDSVVAAMEDGFRPPADPSVWDRIHHVVTGEPCPRCGTALGVILGPTETLERHAVEAMRDYPVSVPDAWTEGYDHPVYVYCDSPGCSWHGVAEWDRLRPVFESWIHGEAPTWRDRVGEVTS